MICVCSNFIKCDLILLSVSCICRDKGDESRHLMLTSDFSKVLDILDSTRVLRSLATLFLEMHHPG